MRCFRIIAVTLFVIISLYAVAQQPIYVFVRTNYAAVNLPTQGGQQVILGSFLIPPREFNSVNTTFDIWAAVTMTGGYYVGSNIQPRFYLCDNATCTGQVTAELAYADLHDPSLYPNGMTVRTSLAMAAAGTNAIAIGSETLQFDSDPNGTRSPIGGNSAVQSQSFDATRFLYLVMTVYLDSTGGQQGTPTAQLTTLRLNVLH